MHNLDITVAPPMHVVEMSSMSAMEDDDDGRTETGPLGPVRIVPLPPLLWPPFTVAFIGSLPVLSGAEFSFSVDSLVPLTSWNDLSTFTKHGVFSLLSFLFRFYYSLIKHDAVEHGRSRGYCTHWQ